MSRHQGTVVIPPAPVPPRGFRYHRWVWRWLPVLITVVSAVWIVWMETQRRKFEIVRETLELPSTIDRISRLELLRSTPLVDRPLIDSLLAGARRASGTSLAYAATFEDNQFAPFAQPTGKYLIEPGCWFEDDHVRTHLCMHLFGPSVMQLTLPYRECRGRRVIAEGWVRSRGISQANVRDEYASGKFHVSWHTKGDTEWAFTTDGDFFSEPSLNAPLVITERWRFVRFVTPLLPDSLDGINLYVGIQGTTGDLWLDDVSVLVY